MSAHAGGRKRLAVPYDQHSFSPLQIAEAAHDVDIVWVLDSSTGSSGFMGPLLSRLGQVIDLAGLSRQEGAKVLAALHPDGIVAFADSQLTVAARLAEDLTLRHNRLEVVTRVLDKYEQRLALAQGNVAGPGFSRIASGANDADLARIVAPLAFPVVLKPVSGQSSRDVRRLSEAGELMALLASSRRGNSHAGVLDISEDLLVEEELADCVPREAQVFADYVSVEAVGVKGLVTPLAITGKFPLEAPYRETGNFLASALSKENEAAVADLACRAALALGFEQGFLHAEIKLTPSGPQIIEINARVAGGGIDELYAHSSGVSLTRLAVLAALGEEIPLDLEVGRDLVRYKLFIQPPMSAHRLVEIAGLDLLAKCQGVDQLQVNPNLHELDWRRGSEQYVLSVAGSVRDHEALARVRTLILDQLVLTFEDYEDHAFVTHERTVGAA